MKNIQLIDGNSLGFAANSSTIQKVGDYETQAINGFLISIKTLFSLFALPKCKSLRLM